MKEKVDNKHVFYLIDHLIKTINLADFIEAETKELLKGKDTSMSAKCCCPFPDHSDRNASFHVKKMEDGVWIFHCFGCNKKGNIIHFCMDFFGLRNKYESILFLCKKFNIKNKEDLILAGIKNISKKVDTQRKMENANVVASNQCRMLLHKDFEKNQKWVADAYKKLNESLDADDEEMIEQIGYEASNKMMEN
jgi:DNA primase